MRRRCCGGLGAVGWGPGRRRAEVEGGVLGHEALVEARLRTNASPELRHCAVAHPCSLDGSGRSLRLGVRTPNGLQD